MSKICRCRSHDGKQKYRYKSPEHAQQAAETRGWRVTIYRCPNRQHTYHITHAKQDKESTAS